MTGLVRLLWLALLPVSLALAVGLHSGAPLRGQEPPPEGVTVSFSPTSYTASEGDASVDITLTMSQALGSDVDVRFVPIYPIPPSDFQSESIVTIPANTTSLTTSVAMAAVMNDAHISSPTRNIWVHLLGTNNTSVIVDETPAVIAVSDDDTSIRWKDTGRNDFVVRENNTFRRCLVLQGISRNNLEVSISHNDPDGALASAPAVPSSVTFNSGDTEKCFTLTAADVTGVSVVDFELTGTNQASNVTILEPSSSSAWVHDGGSSVSFVQFEQDSLSVSEEDGTATLSLSIDPAPSQDVTVGISTIAGTARGGLDFDSLTRSIFFPAGSTASQSVAVNIIDRPEGEPDEFFSVVLQSSDARVAVEHSPATIFISDDDATMVGVNQVYFAVDESSRKIFVGAEIFGLQGSCPTTRGLALRLSTVEGTATASADYEPVSTIIWMGLCVVRRFVEVQLINDAIVEGPDPETFTIKLEKTASTPDFVSVSYPQATVEIFDPFDDATVELEQNQVEVTDGDSFEVTANIVSPDIECPVDFEFDVLIAYSDEAGAIAPGTPNPLLATFKPCSKTTSYTLNTSDIGGTADVRFHLVRPTELDTRIGLSFARILIRIFDDEGFWNLAGEENANPWGIWSDGRTAWASDDADSAIYAYDMQTKARDSDQDSYALDADNDSPRGIWSDGTTMWVADQDDGKIYAYQVSDKARDSTKDFDTLSDAENVNPTGIWSNGTTMWVADDEDDRIYAYNLSSKARDSEREFTSLDSDNSDPTGIWSDGSTMWVADGIDIKIYAYDMATKQRNESKDLDSLDLAGQDNPRGVWSNGHTMWVVDRLSIFAYPLRVPVVRSPRPRATLTATDEPDPARPTAVAAECVSEIVDPDGGEIELGDTIEDRWDYGCQSVTRGGRLAKYYSFTLPITTAVEVALDSHLDDYLVMREGDLSGDLVARDDDSGPSNNSLISGTFPAGQYTIEATTFYADGVEADFTLSVRALPRILYDGPVSDVAHRGYAPEGPTLLIKLLPTLPMGTLEITVEDSDGFGEGAGPLGGEQTAGGSAGQVVIALPTTSWVEYGGTEVEVLQSGEWLAHTTADEESMLAGEVGMELSQAMQELVEIVNLTEGAATLVESLTGMTFPEAQDGVAQPDEALLDAVFRRSHANCVTQVTLDWLVEASPDTTGVRVSVPVSLSDSDHLSVAASFVASEDRPALAQLHDLLDTGRNAPVCQSPVYAVE